MVFFVLSDSSLNLEI